MKISEMTTDQAADVLVRIADPVSNIIHDEESLKVIKRLAEADTNVPVKFFADNIAPIVMVLLKDHRSDVFEVVAALSAKSAEEVAKQKIGATVTDIQNSLDGELLDFFASLGQSRQMKSTN